MIVKVKTALERLALLFEREREILVCTKFDLEPKSKNLILRYFDAKVDAIFNYTAKKVVFFKYNFTKIWGMNDFIFHDSSRTRFQIECFNTASLAIESALRNFSNEYRFI